MLIVVYGYCGPDNYTSDNGPVLKLEVFSNQDQVLEFHKEWLENTAGKDNDQHTFRVFEGRELRLIPVETVTKYQLGS